MIIANTVKEQIYRVAKPIQLASPPTSYSFSLLNTLARCPRRWQLTNSTYPGISGPYPSPYAKKAVQGQVVHEVLRGLVGWLVQSNSPPIGTAEFAKAMQTFDFPKRIQKLMDQQLDRLKRNPRAWRVKELGFRVLDVQNQVFQLLRSTWQGRTGPVFGGGDSECNNQAEIRVEHPVLPLAGYLDLVEIRPDGDVITDYKSGEISDSYRVQVLLYGVLWWRERGRLPRLLRVISVSGDRIEIEPTESDLLRRESELKDEIEQWNEVLQGVAPARVNAENCRFCPVRPLCDDYWHERGLDGPYIDLEIKVEKQRSYASLTGCRGSEAIDVTTEPSSDIDLSTLPVGTRLRILSGSLRADGSMGLTAFSELYRVD